MTIINAQNISDLRTQPHRTKLHLSIYQPDTILACQVNDNTIAKGAFEITYDSVTSGSYLLIEEGMTMYVGSTAGDDDLGKVRVRSATSTVITVAENSHINWSDDVYLTIVDFYEINAVYPRIIQDPNDDTVLLFYKDYDIEYTNQNSIHGTLINMGPHHAGFIETGTHSVYYTAERSDNLTGDTLSYHWWFQGADITGSSAQIPGLINYSTPGHYTTRLTISGTNGAVDTSYRHISIYDRPDEGTTIPIAQWELINLSGSRGSGGYKARIRIRESVSESLVKEGSLIVIFAENWYGDNKRSLAGESLNRPEIVFSGYIIDGTVQYNYRESWIEFDVGSPTEIMKMTEGFSISVQDSRDPAGDAANDPNIPSGWVVLLDMNVRRALYHYLRWHSSVLKCCDIEYKGSDLPLQYFDSDRESLYDAVQTGMNSTRLGAFCCSRHGTINIETPVWDRTQDAHFITSGLDVNKQDWIGEPVIDQRLTREVSFIEMGGIAYSGSTGSFSALLASAPGSAPGYRGSLERIKGLALASQEQLNQLAGDYFAHVNAEFPELTINFNGNYNNFEIAPQERVPITVDADDNVRGISFVQKSFVPESIQWRYDPEKELFLPVVSFYELTSGISGDTITIPIVPPTEAPDGGGGFDQPDIEIPPINLPPFPTIPIGSISGGRLTFIPVQSGYNVTDVAEITVGIDNNGVPAVRFPDNKNCYGKGHFYKVEGFTGTVGKIWLLISAPGVGGHAYIRNWLRFIAPRAHPDSSTSYSVGVADTTTYDTGFNQSGLLSSSVYHIVGPLASVNLTGYDLSYVEFNCYRDATNILDTVGNNIDFYGWILDWDSEI